MKDEINKFVLKHEKLRNLTKGHRPLVSVLIATYNRKDLLVERALPSVFAQTVQDFEVLVVGDGTDQATVDAMKSWQETEDRLRFWNLPHYDYPEEHLARWAIVGLAAFNFALGKATGEWIAVLGDDDEFLPQHHEVLLEAATRTGAQHVYGISETFKRNQYTGQRYGRWPPGDAAFCNGGNLYLADLDYRYDLDCMKKRGRTGDADLWQRMIDDGVRFHFEKEVVHRYHRNWP